MIKGKKGASILMIIFELLAVVSLILITTHLAMGLGRSERVIRINLANELDLMINTLLAVPGDVVVCYPGGLVNLSLYVIKLSGNSLEIKSSEDDLAAEKRFFVLPQRYKYENVLGLKKLGKGELCLKKEGSSLFLGDGTLKK